MKETTMADNRPSGNPDREYLKSNDLHRAYEQQKERDREKQESWRRQNG